MRLTSKGQVTIPKLFCEAIGVAPGEPIECDVEDGAIYIRKPVAKKALGSKQQAKPLRSPGNSTLATDGTTRMTLGERAVAALTGKGDIHLSTDEIMRMTRGDDWNAPDPR